MKRIGSIILIILILLFGYIAFNYISYRTKNAVSEAAFVKTDSLLTLGFKVGGKVAFIEKKEGDYVKKGEILAKIDPIDFQVAKQKIADQIDSLIKKKEALEIKKDKTKKELDTNLNILKNSKEKLKKDIEAFFYEIQADEIKLSQLKRDEKRLSKLYSRKLIQKEKLENIQTKREAFESGVKAKREKLKGLRVELKNMDERIRLIEIKKEGLKELQKEIESLSKNIESLKAAKTEIENKISYCTIYSPIDGQIAKRYINKDRIVKKGSPIFSVVNRNDIHIEVLLSEKKLKGVKKGNSVKITVDAYPDRKYKGKVQKILPASAATFSLVPRDIASGEFTKLDQRFVVRISILNKTPDLRVGMGANVAIERSEN